MKDTKLVRMLKTFSEDEMKDFRKFIASPLYRKRDLTGLLDVLREFHPAFENPKFTNEFVYSKLFSGRKYGDKKSDSLLKTITSELYAVCKEFLIQRGFNGNQNFRQYFLLTELRKRKLFSEFISESKPAIKTIEENTGSIFGLNERSYLSSAFVEYYIDASEFDKCYEMVIRQNEFACASALTGMLRFSSQQDAAEYGYNLRTRKNLTQSILKHLDIESLISELKHDGSSFAAFIEINYIGHLIYSGKTPDASLFKRMKDLLSRNESLLSAQELYIFYSMLASYGNKIFTGTSKISRRSAVVDIYKKMLHLGAHKFSPSDDIQPGLFRSMVISARAARDFDFLKKIIEELITELPEDFRESMKRYALGQYYFGVGEYGKALENLVHLKSEYFLYKKDIKNMLFRIYYSLNYTEEAYSILENLKKYLAGTEDLSEEVKSLTRNFVNFASELLRIRDKGSRKDAEYLINKIMNAEETESADWLIEKLKEIR